MESSSRAELWTRCSSAEKELQCTKEKLADSNNSLKSAQLQIGMQGPAVTAAVVPVHPNAIAAAVAHNHCLRCHSPKLHCSHLGSHANIHLTVASWLWLQSTYQVLSSSWQVCRSNWQLREMLCSQNAWPTASCRQMQHWSTAPQHPSR